MFQFCEVSSFAYEISYDEKSAKKSAKFSTDVKLISAAKAPVRGHEFEILFDARKVQHACHHISNHFSVAGVHCRSLMFEKPVGGRALQQHVFKQIYLSTGIKPYSDCKNRCLMENTCVSVNVGPLSKNGLRVCQLSDSDHIQHPADLKLQEGYQYWATKVRIFG